MMATIRTSPIIPTLWDNILCQNILPTLDIHDPGRGVIHESPLQSPPNSETSWAWFLTDTRSAGRNTHTRDPPPG